MDMLNVYTLARKEVRESLRNKWFILYTVSFASLALLLLFFASSAGEIVGYGGFGRITASLINLVLFFIPLISIITGAMSISNERENGTLVFLLSHPVTKSEIFVGKFTGLLLSLWVSIGLGFGVSGLAISLKGAGTEEISKFILIALLSTLLAASLLSVGFLVSALSKKGARAIGVAVFLWLGFIILGDLGIMGTTIAMDLGIKEVFTLALLNPIQVFKIAGVIILTTRFELLGPVGIYAMRTFGVAGTHVLLIGILALWTIVPLGIAFASFTVWRREE